MFYVVFIRKYSKHDPYLFYKMSTPQVRFVGNKCLAKYPLLAKHFKLETTSLQN